jgi:hypothetical protein
LIRRLVSPTTKVRRLGYFIALCKLLQEQHPAKTYLAVVLDRRAKELERPLAEYCATLHVSRRQGSRIVGAIATKDAARRYIGTAVEIGLMLPLGIECQNTKTGHLLAAVPSTKNPFSLSMPQRLILLEALLRGDYLYLRTLVELILNKEDTNDYKQFRNYVLSYIDGVVKESKNPDEIRQLRNTRKTLLSWHSPDTYYRENIRAPRLEWLLDLELLTKWNQQVDYLALRSGAEKFFSKTDFDDQWFGEEFAGVFQSCFKDKLPRVTYWGDISSAQRNVLLGKYLEKAILLFRPTRGVDKISISQFLTYALCMLLTQEGLVASRKQLESALADLTRSSSRYRDVRMASHLDIGYIVRERPRALP